ncbi:MAG: hypothetical protein RBT67_02745 [Thauera sp.]|jgi:hypothetical protein|nr:hypothetical protein [Thauera sp.]
MIEVVTTFNDGHTRYYAGERVAAQNFQPENLKKFLEYGWVKEECAQAAPLAHGVGATLDIHNGQQGQASKVI